MDPRTLALTLAATSACLPACVGTTGGDLVTFDAAAAGPADAVEGQPYAFDVNGAHVVLDHAVLHVGAVYLNHSRPVTGSQSTSCVDPGIYVAEVTQGLDVDALSPTPQPFPSKGEGTSTPAVVGEVWLTRGDVNDPTDQGTILDVSGTADQGGASYTFHEQLSVGPDRIPPTGNPAEPSLNPICKQRIVPSIGVAITPREGGALLLRLNPRRWFAHVDFSQLQASDGKLYDGLHTQDDYDFFWTDRSTPR